jgi:hypothetical protein
MGNAAGLFDKLDLEFHFTVDLCATPENAKCVAFSGRRTTVLRNRGPEPAG